MMRAWVLAELFEGERKGTEPNASLGRWATFEALPRIGDIVFYSDDNYPGYSLEVGKVEHFLQAGEEETIVRIVCFDECLDEMGEDAIETYRDWLLENGFKLTECLWEADE